VADSTLVQDSALNANPGTVQTQSVCAVTITYGDRQHLLRPVLLALLKEPPIWKIVVVSNAARWDVQGLAEELAPGRIEVLEMGSNRGSSAAYAAGIKRACELGAEFIWLLDDDNEPQEDALVNLLAASTQLRQEFPKDNVAVVGYRADRNRDLAVNIPLWRLKPRPSSFWGFHVFDVPYKLWRRTPWGRPQPRPSMPEMVEIKDAPFGGLLFHREVVERHGVPREDFILYCDDSEFTHRITRSGGALRLIPAAKVIDLDPNWHFSKRYRNSFEACLEGDNDSRMFYAIRNLTYLDSHFCAQNGLVYWINRRVYCLGLWIFALILRRSDRYRLLKRAIRDGLAGRLGVASDLPL
jgi:GT2 family glycosyltransferase